MVGRRWASEAVISSHAGPSPQQVQAAAETLQMRITPSGAVLVRMLRLHAVRLVPRLAAWPTSPARRPRRLRRARACCWWTPQAPLCLADLAARRLALCGATRPDLARPRVAARGSAPTAGCSNHGMAHVQPVLLPAKFCEVSRLMQRVVGLLGLLVAGMLSLP